MDLEQLATHDDIKSLRTTVINAMIISMFALVISVLAAIWIAFP